MILFFDDYLGYPENQLFLHQLRQAIRGMPIKIVEEKIVPRLEAILRATPLRAAIFDVMAAMPENPELSAIAGIEILRRCRNGNYGETNRDIPIFMRTGRSEPHILKMARDYGCTGYFSVGTEDRQLINALVIIMNPLAES